MKFRFLVLLGLLATIAACNATPIPLPTTVPITPVPTANAAATENAIAQKIFATLTASAPQDTVTPPPSPNVEATNPPAPTLVAPTLVVELSPSVTPIPDLPTRAPTRSGGAGPTAAPIDAPLVVSAEGLRGKILFKSTRPDGTYPGKFHYYVMDADGGNVRMVPASDASPLYKQEVSNAGFSPDRSLLVLGEQTCGGNNCRLYIGPPDLVVKRSQGEWATGPSYAAADQPVWSPDGAWIAFIWNRDNDRTKNIFKGDPSRQNQDYKRLTDFGGHADMKNPTYSPDGSQLAFTTNGVGNRWQIWTLNALAENITDAGAHSISDGAYDDWDPVWIR